MFRDEERLLCTSTEIQSVRYEYLDDPRVVTHVLLGTRRATYRLW